VPVLEIEVSEATKAKDRLYKKFNGTGINSDFSMKEFHKGLQSVRHAGEGITLKEGLQVAFGEDMTPESFYKQMGLDLTTMTVEKLLTTNDFTRWLFPEIFRDAIRTGLEYTPFYRSLITGEEQIQSQGLTMPKFVPIAADNVRLRDTAEGASITEGALVAYTEKQVTVKKKARGLKWTYESIMFTPIDLARVYFEELGQRLGSDLDKDLIAVLLNGDQGDGSEASPVIGAATANTLVFTDLVRAWVRFKRIGRTSVAMVMNESEAITILSMAEFNNRPAGGGAGQFANQNAPTLRFQTPLPTSQDIYVHEDVPAKKIIFVDPSRAVVQLTALPLLVESERIVERQLNGEYVSTITGFANVFKDGRLVLDYGTNLSTNPGPSTTF
jgi:HK97 family phage major capsid protein